MAKIMDPDLLYPCCLAAADHFPVQIVLRELEEPVARLHTVKKTEKVLHLITEKVRQLDDPIAFFRFRCCNDILALEPLIGLINPKLSAVEIEIIPGKSKQFSFPTTMYLWLRYPSARWVLYLLVA